MRLSYACRAVELTGYMFASAVRVKLSALAAESACS